MSMNNRFYAQETIHLLFLGKFDEDQLSLERDIIYLQDNSEKDLDIQSFDPNIIKFPIQGHKCNVWILVGNVIPKDYLQNLITKIRLLIFTFNLTKPESLQFLIEEWGSIIEKINENSIKNQERYLIGIFPKKLDETEFDPTEIYSKLSQAMEQLNCRKYFEYGISKDSSEICPIKKSNNLIQRVLKIIQMNESKEDFENIKEEEDKKKDNDCTCISDTLEDKNIDNDGTYISDILKDKNNNSDKEEDKNIDNDGTYFGEKLKYNNSDNDKEEDKNSDNDDTSFRDNEDLYEKNEGDEIIIRRNNLTYKLLKSEHTAEIVCLQAESGIIFIPEFIEYKSTQFKIMQINEKSFSNIGIEALKITFQGDISLLSNAINECKQLKFIDLQSNKEIEIKEKNFNELENLQSITIKGDKITIGNCCFKNCFNNEEQNPAMKDKMIKINGTSLVEIGDKNFNSLKFLKTVEITGNKITIGHDCFENCKSLSSFDVYDANDLSIGKNEFKECNELRFLFLSSAKIRLGICCFSSSNLETIEINSEKLYFGKRCFYGLSSITNLTITNSDDINITGDLFTGCDKLEKISFKSENSVKINKSCFCNFNSLKNVLIDCSSVIFEEFCFTNCKLLDTILFKNLNEAKLLTQSIAGCESLTKIQIESLLSLRLDKFCFANSKNLSSIELASESIIIEERCFENCSKFTKFSILNSRDACFKPYCFTGSMNLSSMDINCENLTIESNCFSKCDSLLAFSMSNVRNTVFNPNSFDGCSNLQNISIHNAYLINFGESCFNGLNNLKSIDIQSDEIKFSNRFINSIKSLSSLKFDFVQKIELNSNTFEGCASLTNIELSSHSSITLSERCFCPAKNLQKVEFKADEIIIKDECFSYLQKLSSTTFECNTINIGQHIFKNCSSLSSISFTNVENGFFGPCAFSGSNLKIIKIFTSSEIILSEYCFCGASNFESIILKGSKVALCSSCFKDCKSLSDIQFLAAQEVTLSSSVFEGCESLKEVEINSKNSITLSEKSFCENKNTEIIKFKTSNINIYNECFSNCQKLNSVTFECNTINIGQRSFKNCSSLSSMIFNKVDKVFIGPNAFSVYSKLKNIVISASSEISLSEYCFCGALNVESITLKSNKVTLGKYCFKACKVLKNVHLEGVQEAILESDVFEGCDSLFNLQIVAAVKLDIRSFCFAGAPNLSNVILNGSTLIIGERIFKECEYLSSVSLISTIDCKISPKAYHGCPEGCRIDKSKLRYKK